MLLRAACKTVLLLAFCLLAAGSGRAQGWQWARSATCSSTSGGSEGWLVKTDPFGNVFMAGFYWGSRICLGPNTFLNPVNPQNNIQTIIAKYDSAGNMLWSAAGSNGYSSPISITTDGAGNAYIFGFFTKDSIRFDNVKLVNPAYDTVDTLSNACYYIVKYTGQGTIAWARCGTGNIYPRSTNSDYLHPGGITADPEGNIYITSTYNTAKLNIGPYTLTNSVAGTTEIFVARYDSLGNMDWAKSFGGSNNDYVSDITCHFQNIYLTGYFTPPSARFGSANVFSNYQSAYLVRLDTAGNTIWANNVQGASTAKCVAADKAGNIYIGGGFTSHVSMGSYALTSAYGGYFLAKYDPFGDVLHAQAMPPNGPATACCEVYGLTTDTCDNVWMSANLDHIAGIKIDSATVLDAPAGATDPMFIAGYDANGSLIQHVSLLSGGGDNTGLSNTGLSADAAGNIYLSGDYQNIDPFVLGSDALHIYNGQQSNIFIAKYNSNISCDTVIIPPPFYSRKITVGPNPATDMLTIQYDGIPKADARVALFDVVGRLAGLAPVTARSTTVSVADLPQGIYFLNVDIDSRGPIPWKILVLH